MGPAFIASKQFSRGKDLSNLPIVLVVKDDALVR
jgi:hypothetical protein